MSYPLTNDAFRLGTTIHNLTVASAGGAATSTAVFGAQTYAIRVTFPAVYSSTGGVRIKIGSTTEAPVASSTADALLAQNVVEYIKVSPGTRLSAISNDAAVPVLNIVELTK